MISFYDTNLKPNLGRYVGGLGLGTTFGNVIILKFSANYIIRSYKYIHIP